MIYVLFLLLLHNKAMMKIGFDAKRAAQNRTGLGNYNRFVIRGLLDAFPGNQYVA